MTAWPLLTMLLWLWFLFFFLRWDRKAAGAGTRFENCALTKSFPLERRSLLLRRLLAYFTVVMLPLPWPDPWGNLSWILVVRLWWLSGSLLDYGSHEFLTLSPQLCSAIRPAHHVGIPISWWPQSFCCRWGDIGCCSCLDVSVSADYAVEVCLVTSVLW